MTRWNGGERKLKQKLTILEIRSRPRLYLVLSLVTLLAFLKGARRLLSEELQQLLVSSDRLAIDGNNISEFHGPVGVARYRYKEVVRNETPLVLQLALVVIFLLYHSLFRHQIPAELAVSHAECCCMRKDDLQEWVSVYMPALTLRGLADNLKCISQSEQAGNEKQ